jgi:general secretion pathway protein D
MNAAARIISAVDKAAARGRDRRRAARSRSQAAEGIRLQIASPGSPGIDGSIDVNREGQTLASLANLTQADVFVTGVPGLYYRLLKTDQNTRTLANPQLRTAEGMPAKGELRRRSAVPVTVFAPIATGGVAQQPVTSFNYRNIGVNIDITPRMHHNDDVSLSLKIEVSSLSGTGFGGCRPSATAPSTRDPAEGWRDNMLAGLIRDDERDVLMACRG